VLRQKCVCPNCGSSHSILFERKYVVTELRECTDCRLLFRYPTDSESDNAAFYQQDYTEGFTTDCPTNEQLATLLKNRFRGTEKDYSTYISILRSLGVRPGAQVFDYGCSWGYGAWQLREAGYCLQGYEISKGRAAFANEKLGLNVSSSMPSAAASFDVFFSAHVLEHVPSIQHVIDSAKKLLRQGGLFVSFTPNGSEPFRRSNRLAFSTSWGKVHPNIITDTFYQKAFAASPLLLASSPFNLDVLTSWERRGNLLLDLSGPELLAAAVF